ncbi:MAG: FAD-dependent oxidoreductase [Slackia sp.]|nr:FAD-dependent oxidoreductase [Slackia sp.]
MYSTSRRTFIKAGALAGISALGATTLASCAPKTSGSSQSSSVQDIAWDGCFDVVVVGFGAAGAASAIAAAEAGAKVLIVDKAPEGHEGGNSRYCAQLFVSINDFDQGLEHYKALRGQFYTPDDVLEAYVQGMCDIRSTLVSWGADESGMVDLTDKKISNLTVEYPELPGSSAVRTNLIDGTISQAGLWRFLKKGVVERADSIDCWYESPATSLIQDPVTKAIVGVEIDHDGKSTRIAARNGVVMALGGFENNAEYMQQATGYTTVYPIGTLYNEGDGIRMAQEIGAKMWHMGAWESNGIGLTQQEDRVRNLSTRTFFTSGSVVLVGTDGSRYIAEDLEQRHGHLKIAGSWIMPQRPLRNFFVFDEAQKADLEAGKAKYYATYNFTNIDSKIENGLIFKADTLDEIATHFDMDPAILNRTIELFNQAVQTGVDAFGRSAESMRAFGEGPYYALEAWPSVLNTQGGPERTARGEVLAADGTPIPHLYSAGEYGGVTANDYQGGGNIAECVVFGKISGEAAAEEKEDAVDIDASSLEFVPGCGTQSIYEQTPDASNLGSNEKVGVGEGLGGPIWVKVTTDGSSISNVEIIHATETEGVGDAALDNLPGKIVEANGIEVDAIAGATVTSSGIIKAVANALES